MLRGPAPWCIGLALAVGLLACGPSEEQLALDQLELDLETADAAVDSLRYTVESAALAVDDPAAQLDSTREGNDGLLASVQQLGTQVERWRRLADEYERSNQRLALEIARLKEGEPGSLQRLAGLRLQADSLAGALLEAHSNIRRRSDRIGSQERELEREHDPMAQLEGAGTAVSLLVGFESRLRASGHLDVTRPLGLSTRRAYRAAKAVEPEDPDVLLLAIGESTEIEGDLRVLVDRYGELQRGVDYEARVKDGRVTVTITNGLLAGTDVLAVLAD
jgi:hypothetical protein